MRCIEIQADDDMIRALEHLAVGESKSLEAFVKEVLARYLKVRGRARASRERPSARSAERGGAEPYRIRPISAGRCYFDSLDNVADVLAAAEGEDYR